MPLPGCFPRSDKTPGTVARSLLVGALACLPAVAAEQPHAPASAAERPPLAAADADAADAADADAADASPARRSWWAGFRDPEDGRFDASTWLLERRGALPVPIIVTEPAIGYGGGVALLFFQRPAGAPQTRTTADGTVRPITPNIYAGLGFKTENGTHALGAAAFLHFDEDRWRYKGGVASPHINLDYYATGAFGATRQIGYTVEGIASLQQVQRRIGEGDLYVGLRWVYMDFDARLDVESDRAAFEPREFAQRNSGLGLGLEYDVRDNWFTASRGWLGAVEATAYATAFGGDTDYQTYRGKLYAYRPLFDGRLVVGGRADVRWAQGDVPFYAQPYVELRGIPAARYQDRRAAVLETELRWNLTPRWALVGFLGGGRAWGRREGFGDAGTAVAKGGGFRYLIARRLGLYTGLDYAWGPEDSAVYVQVGSAWR